MKRFLKKKCIFLYFALEYGMTSEFPYLVRENVTFILLLNIKIQNLFLYSNSNPYSYGPFWPSGALSPHFYNEELILWLFFHYYGLIHCYRQFFFLQITV
ncbi:hypothetical protein GDO78_021361 [Eleutherodactylus coqui]|uniref:Uncharacterized protein n=1 Tax=Eleutherodactylus coqui TaxID=57060 RepID=A0A8J6EGZ8_ELECQ|nr:hypothetical protein GDO78_021361 [Eleutherodactylus coqui]